MWSNVVDKQGRTRAQVFYKAAFYDRAAHSFGLETRYRVGSEYLSKDHKDRRKKWFAKDAVTEREVFSLSDVEVTDFFVDNPNEKAVQAWLDENFPDHKNPNAYWDA
jgi:hypothetical protein